MVTRSEESARLAPHSHATVVTEDQIFDNYYSYRAGLDACIPIQTPVGAYTEELCRLSTMLRFRNS